MAYDQMQPEMTNVGAAFLRNVSIIFIWRQKLKIVTYFMKMIFLIRKGLKDYYSSHSFFN